MEHRTKLLGSFGYRKSRLPWVVLILAACRNAICQTLRHKLRVTTTISRRLARAWPWWTVDWDQPSILLSRCVLALFALGLG